MLFGPGGCLEVLLLMGSHCILKGLSLRVRADRLHSMARPQGLTVTDIAVVFFFRVK